MRVAAMFKWGLVYFLLAVASGVMGVTDTHPTTAALAQLFLFGNVVLFVVFTLLGSINSQPMDPADTPKHSDR
jgi:uncharacterized membrane protein YtjA (UPF0391 family)